jgi:hypothetical protein
MGVRFVQGREIRVMYRMHCGSRQFNLAKGVSIWNLIYDLRNLFLGPNMRFIPFAILVSSVFAEVPDIGLLRYGVRDGFTLNIARALEKVCPYNLGLSFRQLPNNVMSLYHEHGVHNPATQDNRQGNGNRRGRMPVPKRELERKLQNDD